MKNKWQIMGQSVYSCGTYKTDRNKEWITADSIPQLYKDTLKDSGHLIIRSEKFFRVGEKSAITILLALLILQQLQPQEITDFSTTAILGFGNIGSHQGNLTYWNDYNDNGRQAAQGHLFVGTLASTPLSQLALTLGCHAPVYYVCGGGNCRYAADELEFIHTQCENLFLIEEDTDFCNCMLLRSSCDGFSSEEIIKIRENFK